MNGLTSALNRPRPRPEPRLARTVVAFDLKTEAAALMAEAPWKANGHNAKTLVRRSDSRIVLLAMKAAARAHQHKHDASSTIQVETGRVRVHLQSEVVELTAGMLLSFVKGRSHDIEALEESTLVLTFALS
jgi:quercetin dioxygenase-like cupin family protein